MDSGPMLRDMVPFEAVQGAQQTSLTTRPLRWVVSLYDGPAHGRGLWARARAAVTTYGRPLVERLAFPAVVVEFVRLVLAISRFDSLIRPCVRSTYHRDDLDAIAADADVEQAHMALLAQAVRTLQALPAGARGAQEHAVFPRDVMRDETVAQRVVQASRVLDEVSASLRRLGHGFDVSDPGDKPPVDPCPWAYDPAVPTAIARRLMAGRRVAFAPHLVRVARGTWSVQAQRQAALDWADDVEDFVGFFGALFDLDVPSLPSSARLDIGAVMADHAAVQAASAVHLRAAIEAIQAG